jgi:uncharacterized RDD family membrane protein YckC
VISAPDSALDGPRPDPAPVEYAGLLTRTIGMAIDALLINVVAALASGAVLLVRALFSVGAPRDTTALAVIGSCLYVIFVLVYFVGFWTTTGQTVGNRVMQTRIVAANGGNLPPRRGLTRMLGMMISIPLLWGFLPILVTPRRRAVCDLMARTVVIFVAPAEQPNDPPAP